MEPRLPQPLDRVDRYVVLFELGRGGMAAVYAARRQGPGGFDKLVALKLLLPHLSTEPRFRELFLNEARLVAKLEHPNVVTVFDLAEHEGAPLLVMELVRGQSLRRALDRLRPERRLPFGLKVALGVAEGLHAAHRASAPDGAPLGIVHRDVSPENVLIGYDGRIKVADFGIAKARAASPATLTGEVRGKLGYLSPEQVTRAYPIGAHADVWALGVVLFEIAYGYQPFVGETDAETLWNVTSRSLTLPDDPSVPAGLRELIASCLAREPERRPVSAWAVLESLREVVAAVGAASCDVGAGLREAFEAELAEEARRLSMAADAADGERASLSPAATPASQSAAQTKPTSGGRRSWLVLGVVVLSVSGAAWALRSALSPEPSPSRARSATTVPTITAPPALAVVPEPTAQGVAAPTFEPANLVPAASGDAAPATPAARPLGSGASRAKGARPSVTASAAASPLLENPYP